MLFPPAGQKQAPYLFYILPVILIIVATLVKFYAFPTFGHKIPFVLYTIAILICAAYMNLASAFIALLTAIAFSLSIYFLPGLYTAIPADPYSPVVIYIVSGLILLLISTSILKIAGIKKEKDEYFKLLADNAPLIIWQTDSDGRMIYLSKQWEDFSGLTMEESQGQGWKTVLHPDDEPETQKFSAIFRERRFYQAKLRLKGKGDDEYRWFLLIGRPLLNKDAFEGYVGTLTDITEQEIAQQQNHSLLKKMDEFISIASHELKTPITSISGYLQILERNITENTDPTHVNFIKRARTQICKLNNLVQDLLDVSKINEDGITYRWSEFRAKELIDDALESTKNNYPYHKVEVEGEMDFSVKADRFRLEQVLCNLLSNAIKYSPDSDCVKLKVSQSNNCLRVSVVDSGIGIPQKKISRIFDRFYRVDNNSERFTGLGIGLYICAEILKKHKGDIQVHSQPGKGSIFSFSIPLSPPAMERG